MPRKKTAEVEILPPEDNQAKQGRPKIVEAKHTIEFKAPHAIEEPINEDEEIEIDDDLVAEDRPKKKRQSYREELRKKLRAQGVSPATRLTITIERYTHSESGESGMWADREFCAKNFCEEQYVLDEGYMDLLKQWGPGTYRITLRLNGTIVDAFDKRVAAPPKTTPIIQHVNPNDPTSPQVIVQTTNGDGQAQQIPMSIKDIMKTQREALKEQFEMAKLMREAYGFAPEQSQANQQQTTDPELAALQLITKNPDVMEKIAGGLAKTIFGGKGGSDDAPWWADILKDSITTGQLAPTVQGVVKALFPNGLFGGLFPGGNNNGQAPTTQAQTQAATTAPATTPEQHSPNPNALLSDGVHAVHTERTGEGVSGVTPEQHALSRLIENCQRNVPVQVAFQQLVNYADAINEQAPEYSIDGYIDLLGSMETEQVIEFVKSLPGGEQIASLPHAASWTSELQRLIKESQEGEEE
jgi:hypothetical protein